MTFVGLLLVLLGWILLLFGGQLSLVASSAMGRPLPIEVDPGRIDVAQSLIMSGFGFAILGALRAGVGTLRQFFEAVLQRAAAAKAQPAPAPPSSARVDPDAVVERGWIRDRPFVRYADGSVEVETLLGVRRFGSFADAEGFVGS
ncbi:hypothetical protein SAMN05519104_2633 [Rhizobiales bacterium GAS188]|nr:hypothetical protein SAMN05519104_2633 [Rhizobiales bacterium GAS188]